ncbi:MAG: metallophosphoesterase [Acidimicrobiia bacterium]
MTNYDVIGDIHGEYDALVALLTKLGYREPDGAWRKSGHQAVFVGDLIDRGQGQLEVLGVARRMVDAGAAQIVMGNHEFNAIAWTTPKPDGGHYRSHDQHHFDQHEAFLAAVGAGSALHDEWVEWFRSIPMWLSLDGALRVVHACWDETKMKDLAGPSLRDEHVSASKGEAFYEAIERVLKGPEIYMEGAAYYDKEGTGEERKKRYHARYQWWSPDARTLGTGAEIPDDVEWVDGIDLSDHADKPLPEDLPGAPVGTPVLYGHYWRPGHKETPSIDQGGMSACLDWSAAKGGPLVAYCWEGESRLTTQHLVSVRP